MTERRDARTRVAIEAPLVELAGDGLAVEASVLKWYVLMRAAPSVGSELAAAWPDEQYAFPMGSKDRNLTLGNFANLTN